MRGAIQNREIEKSQHERRAPQGRSKKVRHKIKKASRASVRAGGAGEKAYRSEKVTDDDRPPSKTGR